MYNVVNPMINSFLGFIKPISGDIGDGLLSGLPWFTTLYNIYIYFLFVFKFIECSQVGLKLHHYIISLHYIIKFLKRPTIAVTMMLGMEITSLSTVHYL